MGHDGVKLCEGARRPEHRSRPREREALSIAAAMRWPEAQKAYAEGHIGAAELACIYVAERVYRASGSRWLQAERRPKLPSTSTSRAVRVFAERELYRIPSAVHRALVAWAEGARPVDLWLRVPSAREILALQARGRRVVSLLEDGIPTAPHEDGLAFAVHDLCHLEKFMDPAHHVGQVGFFALMNRALRDGRWSALEATLDETWIEERNHVIADMNGSAAFLYLTLKNKLKLAIRRQIARARGVPCPNGPLDPGEIAACDEAYEALLGLLGLGGEALAVARRFTSRLAMEVSAAPLVAHFTEAGEAALRTDAALRERADE
jgi:hypothetical protein